jgi:hypothetical protein
MVLQEITGSLCDMRVRLLGMGFTGPSLHQQFMSILKEQLGR